MKRAWLTTVAALSLLGSADAAVAWAGANATTGGYGVHAGVALLPVPFLGTLGVEGSAERGWTAATLQRLTAGVTLRDLNLPLTRTDAFATLGGEYLASTDTRPSTLNAFAEAGLRGALLGPAGWRVFARGNTAGQFGAGVGLELRF